MVAVLVRDEDGINVFEVLAGFGEAPGDLPAAQARVHQQARAAGRD
jgi:hypothetical protein